MIEIKEYLPYIVSIVVALIPSITAIASCRKEYLIHKTDILFKSRLEAYDNYIKIITNADRYNLSADEQDNLMFASAKLRLLVDETCSDYIDRYTRLFISKAEIKRTDTEDLLAALRTSLWQK